MEELLLEPDIPPLEPPSRACRTTWRCRTSPTSCCPKRRARTTSPTKPDELLPDAAGEDDELPPDAAANRDEELCATATLDSANNAAAVAALKAKFQHEDEPPGKGGIKDMHPSGMQATCPLTFQPA